MAGRPDPSAAPAPAAQSRSRFPLFAGLRALAAIAVVVYHAGPYTGAGFGEGPATPYFARLNVGVAVFFVISGCLLYRPMLAARAAGEPFGVRRYARRRFGRIVPGYWVALTLLMLYPGLPDMPTGHNWVYYLFAQDYSADTLGGGIGPAWTLGCEVSFYALLPTLSICLERASRRAGRRIWWRLELATIAVLVAGSAVYRMVAVADPAPRPPATLPSYLGWFGLGMLLALTTVGLDRRPCRWLVRVQRHAWLGWPVAAIAYTVMCHCGATDFARATASPQSTVAEFAVYALSGVIAVAVTLPAAVQRTPRGPVGRLLCTPALAWLGLVSYGIYIYHVPIMVRLNAALPLPDHPTLRALALTTATLALAVAAAALSYYLIERPVARLLTRPSVPASCDPQGAMLGA